MKELKQTINIFVEQLRDQNFELEIVQISLPAEYLLDDTFSEKLNTLMYHQALKYILVKKNREFDNTSSCSGQLDSYTMCRSLVGTPAQRGSDCKCLTVSPKIVSSTQADKYIELAPLLITSHQGLSIAINETFKAQTRYKLNEFLKVFYKNFPKDQASPLHIIWDDLLVDDRSQPIF